MKQSLGNITVTEINMEPSKSSILCFTGNADVQAFLTKVEIHAALKGYTGEKLAQALASKLEGPAFDVYLRLAAAEADPGQKLTGAQGQHRAWSYHAHLWPRPIFRHIRIELQLTSAISTARSLE